MVPVLHIAGVPSTAQQKSKLMLHHTLGDGRYFLAIVTFFIQSYSEMIGTTRTLKPQSSSPFHKLSFSTKITPHLK
jgi:TPP-dependent 2-oxoacid decarboxylase